jgi:hypothetical protein
MLLEHTTIQFGLKSSRPRAHGVSLFKKAILGWYLRTSQSITEGETKK